MLFLIQFFCKDMTFFFSFFSGGRVCPEVLRCSPSWMEPGSVCWTFKFTASLTALRVAGRYFRGGGLLWDWRGCKDQDFETSVLLRLQLLVVELPEPSMVYAQTAFLTLGLQGLEI